VADVQKFPGDVCATWRLAASCWKVVTLEDVTRRRQPVSDGRSRQRWWPARGHRPIHGRARHRDMADTTPRRTSDSAASAARRSTYSNDVWQRVLLLAPTTVAGVERSSAPVCVSVCLFVSSITQIWMIEGVLKASGWPAWVCTYIACPPSS